MGPEHVGRRSDAAVRVRAANSGKSLKVGSHRWRRRLAFEPGEAVLDVGRVIDLSLLAVVDDVEPGRALRADDVVHGGAHAGVERRMVVQTTVFMLAKQRHQIVGARQAPDMRREDPHGNGSLRALHVWHALVTARRRRRALAY